MHTFFTTTPLLCPLSWHSSMRSSSAPLIHTHVIWYFNVTVKDVSIVLCSQKRSFSLRILETGNFVALVGTRSKWNFNLINKLYFSQWPEIRVQMMLGNYIPFTSWCRAMQALWRRREWRSAPLKNSCTQRILKFLNLFYM